MKRRGIDTRRVFNPAMLSALVSSRQFAAAREFARRHPDPKSTPIPEIVDHLGETFLGRSVLDPDPLANKLTRRAIAPVRGTEIIMVVGAGCYFSRDALQDIVLDAPLLAKLRAANLLVLMSPGGALPTDFVKQWNQKHREMPLYIAYRREEWRNVDVREVPHFFVFRNGVLQASVSGWPKEGNKAALLKALGG